MSQDSILKLLEKSKKPLSVKEISKLLNISSVNPSLTKLLKWKEIKMIEVGKNKRRYYFT